MCALTRNQVRGQDATERQTALIMAEKMLNVNSVLDLERVDQWKPSHYRLGHVTSNRRFRVLDSADWLSRTQ